MSSPPRQYRLLNRVKYNDTDVLIDIGYTYVLLLYEYWVVNSYVLFTIPGRSKHQRESYDRVVQRIYFNNNIINYYKYASDLLDTMHASLIIISSIYHVVHRYYDFCFQKSSSVFSQYNDGTIIMKCICCCERLQLLVDFDSHRARLMSSYTKVIAHWWMLEHW